MFHSLPNTAAGGLDSCPRTWSFLWLPNSSINLFFQNNFCVASISLVASQNWKGQEVPTHQLESTLLCPLPRESRAMVETGSALLPSPCQEECSFPWKTGKTVTNWHGQWQGGHPRISLKWVLVGDPWLWHEMETFCGRKWRTSLYSQSWILPSGLWYYQQC